MMETKYSGVYGINYQGWIESYKYSLSYLPAVFILRTKLSPMDYSLLVVF